MTQQTKEQLRRELQREGAELARSNALVLAEFCERSKTLRMRQLQGYFMGAQQYTEAIAGPSTLCLKVENLWNEVVLEFAKDYARLELQRRGLEL